MKRIAILASLTFALVPVAVDGAAAADCYATNCTINVPPNSTTPTTGAGPKLEDELKQLSKDTEHALTAPKKPEPPTEPTRGLSPSEKPAR
jgi:hypothetical protein